MSIAEQEGEVPAMPEEGAPLWRSPRACLALLRRDPLMQNSFFIMASTTVMALLGFGFWVLCARLFSPAQIGVATALISATSLISYVSLLGFNSTFIRFLPASADRDAEINTGLILIFGAALLAGAAYILGVPSFVPALRFVRSSPGYTAGFVALTAFAAVNLATDSVFIAYRAARYNLLVDGVIQGGVKLAAPLLLVGLGAFGIFAATGVAAAVAVGASIVFMVRPFGYRPHLSVDRAVVRHVRSFSAANYLANLLNLGPIFLLPLIVLDRLGQAANGYYYVAFSMGNLLNAVAYAVSQSLFAEGSYEGSDLRRLVVRSARLQAAVMLPASATLALGAAFLLSVFGHAYRQHAEFALILFAVAAPGVALNNWTSALLRLTRQLRALVWSNILYVVTVAGLALLWAPRGIGWIAGAWLAGNLASGAAGGAALLARRRPTKSRQGAPQP